MSKKNYIELNEEGFASIVIALVLITVLALLTVGFAQLARREQQDALDKQLATQAFDAAETGINDARADIKSGAINSGDASFTSCMTASSAKPLPPTAITATPQISTNDGVGYTCLLVNLTPSNLRQDVGVGGSWATVFSATNGAGLQSFDFTWQTSDGQSNTPPPGTNFPQIGLSSSSQWGKSPAIVQLSITPLIAEDRTSLINNTWTAYLRPSTDPAGSFNYPTDPTDPTTMQQDQGQIIPAQCTTGVGGGLCTTQVNLTGPIASQPGEAYLIEAISYEDSSQLGIGNGIDVMNKATDFSNSQAIIDVTGQARQVLKRLQEYVPLNPSPSLSAYALEAQDICKRFTTIPGNSQQSPPSTGDPNMACQL